MQFINDRLWAELQSFIPPRPTRHERRGRKPCDDRQVLEGISYVLTRGIAWTKLPPAAAGLSGVTCYKWRNTWTVMGAWDAIEAALIAGLERHGHKVRKTSVYKRAAR